MQWPAYASIVAKFQERLDKLSNKINRGVFHSGQQVLIATYGDKLNLAIFEKKWPLHKLRAAILERRVCSEILSVLRAL